ncbi:DUF1330 domain-containing protein [Streptomyces alkaliphilus]|uniref:DUF1330 domain-containing protein n=1 Tax=Streptomyces alkaliphilus TaxID=1472722 RepID=A0A7W3TH92_9ACTN|nr:DUF1330 domain-containing protein [Streptomyces alkaliphilus]MBB0246480.1 DUF1330 domain-containing protein [Streptomyces alkaliphilus]
MAVNPRQDDLRRFVAEDPDGPVVMLNLLRFAEGGREAYRRYSRAVAETFLPRHGGEVLYAGEGAGALVAEEGQEWDAVLLVRYPSRAAFLAMVSDPGYRDVARWRAVALTEAVLQPTRPWGRPDRPRPAGAPGST